EREGRDDGDEQRPLQLDERDGEHGGGQARDRADGQIDLADEEHKNDAEGDRADRGALHREVHEVGAREEDRIQDLEDAPDDHEADEDRQGSELARAHARGEQGRRLAEAPRTEQRRVAVDQVDGAGARCVRAGVGHRRPPSGRRRGILISRPAPGSSSGTGAGAGSATARACAESSIAPVMAAMRVSLVISDAWNMPFVRPRRSTTIRSATAITSAMLWLMRITPWPRPRSR